MLKHIAKSARIVWWIAKGFSAAVIILVAVGVVALYV